MSITDDHLPGEALPASESFLRLVLDHTSDLIAVVGLDGRRLYNNSAYRELFGERDLRGTDSFEEIHPDDRERIREIFRDTVSSGVGHRAQYRFVLLDGGIRHIESQGNAILDGNGKVAKVVVISRDITERKLAEERLASLNVTLEAEVAARTAELARALEAAKAAERMKSEFMAGVSHELRTPLNSVIGFAELLKDGLPGPLNPKQAVFVADILAGGERLLALVEGILELSRLDAAGTGLKREPVNIGAVLEERVAVHRKAASARGIGLQLEVAPETGSAALDPQALQRMLDALLDNAIKFNRDGGAVAVRARRAGGRLEIEVTDSGIGIAPADLPQLFKPLTQLDAGLAREHGGLGLGLALARRLAELQGGTIDVQSEPGKGSSFTLRLPLEE